MRPPNAVALHLVPYTAKAAKRWVKETHRHLKVIGMTRFAAAVADDAGKVRGVAVVGNGPAAWEGTGRMVIERVATDGTPNACSMLYGAICRAGRALGYVEAWTYTLPEEPGTSLRAAGFREMGWTAGGEHSRAKRPRKKAERPDPKRRWFRALTSSVHPGETHV